MENKKTVDSVSHNTQRGFATLAPEKQKEIARKGGIASAEKAGHAGMSERGKRGGKISASEAGHEGMAERGRHGAQASRSSKQAKKNEQS